MIMINNNSKFTAHLSEFLVRFPFQVDRIFSALEEEAFGLFTQYNYDSNKTGNNHYFIAIDLQLLIKITYVRFVLCFLLWFLTEQDERTGPGNLKVLNQLMVRTEI